ncbi:AI-2E family transporter [Ruminococcus sp. Marseille-P6503]|uniref:AI-2E family transporter n=1 Tax=Ruminococcus sp. Marseille-P6503 TaxID=2364796 RepID=UPI000F5389DD|nr:AI-2E family transporter [Ruminococcus sp. Marseille-P6503]
MKKTDKFKEHVLLVVIGVVLFWALFNYEKIFHLLGWGMRILSPFVIGVVLALILNVPMSAIERTMFRPDKNNSYRRVAGKIKRPVSLILTLIIFFGVIVLVLYLIIPELIATFTRLSEDIPDFIKDMSRRFQDSKQLNRWLDEMNISREVVTQKLQEIFQDGVLILKTVNSTVSVASSMISTVVNFFIGIFFAVYMLLQKEKLKNQLYRITMAFFPKRAAELLCHICNMSKSTFSKFLSGQCTEAFILGSLCCIGMSILKFPNAVTIGILVAVTAFIPIVGAFIGVAVGAFLIMVTDFMQAVWFVVFMLILQQIEGNLIYPKVVGQSVGLPSLWVLFAVTIGGAVGGIVGMFISVPICSVLYCLLREAVVYLNTKKGYGSGGAGSQAACCGAGAQTEEKEAASEEDGVKVISRSQTSEDSVKKSQTVSETEGSAGRIFKNNKKRGKK